MAKTLLLELESLHPNQRDAFGYIELPLTDSMCLLFHLDQACAIDFACANALVRLRSADVLYSAGTCAGPWCIVPTWHLLQLQTNADMYGYP